MPTLHFKTFVLTLSAVGLACSLPSPAAGGERITFSDQKGQVDLPSANVKIEQDKSKPFDFLRSNNGGSGGPSAPNELSPSLAPTTLRGKALREREKYLDQQRNWIFLRPENLSTTSTPEETFGVDHASMTGQDQKPKKLLEQYWDSMGNTGQSKSNRVSQSNRSSNRQSDEPLADPDKLDTTSPGSSSATLSPSLSGVTSTAADRPLNPLLNPIRPADGLGHSLGELPGAKALGGDGFGLSAMKPAHNERLNAARLKASDAEFRQLLQPVGATAPLSGIGDPINSPLDQTRPTFNPVAPARSVDTAAGKGSLDQLQLPSLSGLAKGASMSGLDILGTKTVGPSSLSPAVATPTIESPFTQAKPVMLEIPRPRF